MTSRVMKAAIAIALLSSIPLNPAVSHAGSVPIFTYVGSQGPGKGTQSLGEPDSGNSGARKYVRVISVLRIYGTGLFCNSNCLVLVPLGVQRVATSGQRVGLVESRDKRLRP